MLLPLASISYRERAGAFRFGILNFICFPVFFHVFGYCSSTSFVFLNCQKKQYVYVRVAFYFHYAFASCGKSLSCVMVVPVFFDAREETR